MRMRLEAHQSLLHVMRYVLSALIFTAVVLFCRVAN